MLIDSHCHLGDKAFDADRAGVVERAWEAGLEGLVIIGESPAATTIGLQLASDEPRISVSSQNGTGISYQHLALSISVYQLL